MTDPALIRAAIAEIRAGLNVLPSLAEEPGDSTADRIARHQRRRDATDRFASHLEATLGARITDSHSMVRVRLHGLSATSTGGIAAALRNWLGAADRKIRLMQQGDDE